MCIFMDFYESWNFLENHKIFNGEFADGLWIQVVKINPETNQIETDKSKNTKIQVWLEHGPYFIEYRSCSHDYDLDCGGDTFEDAIIEMAKLVKKYYTDNGEKIIRE